MTIGGTLKNLRGEKALQEVADSLGITKQALFNYETDQRIPRDEIKIKIAEYYNRSVQELFFAQNSNKTLRK